MYRILLFFCLFSSLWSALTGPSSAPYISGDTWRNNVDHILSSSERFTADQVKTGDMIFVEQDSLGEFASFFIPYIQAPYILITANCDNGGDDPMPGRHAHILSDPHLYAWFTQNLDRTDHPKLHPIPIGLANRKYPWGNIELYDAIIPEARARQRNKWVLVNFTINTNPVVRQPCWDYFSQEKLGGMVHSVPVMDHLSYMKEMPDYIFVVSPPGNGLDCHRPWQALLLGCYPIVLSSSLNALYEDLPVVIVNSWEDITSELLLAKYKELKEGNWNYEKLYFSYWYRKVKELQNKLVFSKDSLK